ncbi:hypothetical protein WANA31_0987 [Wolbachia endosymbiont of Drosophila ananassae]|nr:hypothetical protein WANA31_0987 [Wolbachia endosymbiont of Drosophila ananassae]
MLAGSRDTANESRYDGSWWYDSSWRYDGSRQHDDKVYTLSFQRVTLESSLYYAACLVKIKSSGSK